MKKGLLLLLILIGGAVLFADPSTSTAGQDALATVTFNLTGDGDDNQVRFVVGFTDDNSSLADSTLGNDPVVPQSTFVLKEIVSENGKNYGTLATGDNAYVYWIIVGNNEVSISLKADTQMTGGDVNNTLGLDTTFTEAKDRGSGISIPVVDENGAAVVFSQDGLKVMNWGYAKLDFKTHDLGAEGLAPDKYTANLTLNVTTKK